MLMSSSKAFGVTPGCRPGFCGLPPLHVSGASLGCVGSCIISSVGIRKKFLAKNLGQGNVLGQRILGKILARSCARSLKILGKCLAHVPRLWRPRSGHDLPKFMA